MGDEHDSWFKPFGFDVGKFASDTVETVKNAVAPVIGGGQLANDFRIPEAPPPEPNKSVEPNQSPKPPTQSVQPPEPPSDDSGGGGITGNSDGAPFSASGTTPPPVSSPSPRPVAPDDGLLEKFGTVVGGLVDGAIEIVKEIPDLIPHGTLPGPVILVPIKELKKAAGIPDPDDGA